MGISYSQGAAYGWRARIGLLQPGVVSDTNPFEFYMMAPPGVQMVLTSLGLGGMSDAGYERVVADLEIPLRRLIARKPDAIMQTGVPPIVHHGWGIEERMRNRVAEVTSIPYISDCAASILAMKALGMERIVVLNNAFDEQPQMTGLVKTYFEHAGIDVVAHERIRAEPAQESVTLPQEVVYRTARELYQRHAKEADGVWLTQASVPSVGVVADLEEDLQVPVVTSAQALMWAALLLAGMHEPIVGFGKLFDVQEIDY